MSRRRRIRRWHGLWGHSTRASRLPSATFSAKGSLSRSLTYEIGMSSAYPRVSAIPPQRQIGNIPRTVSEQAGELFARSDR